MRKIFTLILSAFFVAGVFAQKPEGVIMQASVDPVIDAEIDEVWAEANVYPIDKPFRLEVPTVDGTTWKALWTVEGIYVLVECKDDAWLPMYLDGGTPDYMYDKVELYFDVNYILADGVGASYGAGSGHYMVAPAPQLDQNDGRALTTTFMGSPEIEATYSITVSEPNANYEYFIPMEALVDGEGIGIDLTATIGFDVTMVDRDPGDAGRKRAVWANIGLTDESWNNMDDCGQVTFDGATPLIYVESVSLEDAVIDQNNGMVQIIATVLPENATNKKLKWTIENGTGRATISKDGVVTGILDGTVTVNALAADGSYMDDMCTVSIFNQLVSIGELNVIKNWVFDEVNANGTPAVWGGWIDEEGKTTQVVDGVATMFPDQTNTSTPADPQFWRYQFSQNGLQALPDVEYEFGFTAWADEDQADFPVDFEDYSGNNYERYGATTSPWSGDGRSEWHIPITSIPSKYTMDVTFDRILENTDQKVQFMPGLITVGVYLDSVYLVSAEDLSLISDYIAVESITVSGPDTVAVNGTAEIAAEVLPADALLTDVRWSVVNGTGEATIDTSGVLTGVAAGVVTVVASAKDDSNVLGSINLSLNYDYILVESIIVSGLANVLVGTTAQMLSEVLPAEAKYADVKWSVVNGSGVATINEAGLLTGISAGTITVVASAEDASKVSGILNISIQDCDMSGLIEFNAKVSDVSCYNGGDGSIDISVSGPNSPFTFNWSNGDQTEDLNNLISSTYELVIRDIDNCIYKETFDISQPKTLKIESVDISTPLCNGDKNGSISFILSGGVTPYKLDINQGNCMLVEGGFCDSLGGGEAIIEITDDNGCKLIRSYYISEPQPIRIDLYTSQKICYGDSSGYINSSVYGGTPPFSYIWGTGEIIKDLENLQTGIYSLTVFDNNGCVIDDSTEVMEFEKIASSDITGHKIVSESDISIYSVNQTTGSIFNWKVSGGNIISGQLTNVITVQWGNPGKGNISVYETDEKNCSGDTVEIEVIIESPTGITKSSLQNYSIYPNPAKNFLTIETNFSDFLNIEITSLSGKSLFNVNRKGPINQIDLSSYPKGVYFITIRSEDFVSTKKVIKL